MPKTTQAKALKKPSAHNLRSGPPPESINRESPDHNHFDPFASDEDSIPSNKRFESKIDNLCSTVASMNSTFDTRLSSMNTKFDKKFDSILDVLNVHNNLFRTNNMLNDPDTTPVTSSSMKNPALISAPKTPSATATGPNPNTTGTIPVDTKLNPQDNEEDLPPVPSTLPSPCDAPDTTPVPTFGQNPFSIMVSGASKIKYMSMETYLKDKVIENDSISEIEKMYNDILMSLTFVFEMDLSFLPPYKSLGRDIDFESSFLCDLHGFTLSKCRSVFLRLGTILKSRLTSTSYIASSRSPKAAIIIKANPLATGWSLLEKILCERLVLCGGVHDYDLDLVRTNLIFQQNESYLDFYIRTQHLLNEYELCYRNPNFIPTIKIMKTFLTQLNRAQEYVPFLTNYLERLTTHISNFGDVDNSYRLQFTIHEVYDFLTKMNVLSTPTQLRPHITHHHKHTSFGHNKSTSSYTTYNAVTASFETNLDSDDETSPTICAKLTPKRDCCQACLIGFHPENDCFLRGINFQPVELQCRMKVYNRYNI